MQSDRDWQRVIGARAPIRVLTEFIAALRGSGRNDLGNIHKEQVRRL